MKLEKKMRRKEQVWVVRGSENATKLVPNAQPFLGGGTTLSGVHQTAWGGGTATPCNVPISAALPFRILGTTLSSELQFRLSKTFWKANEILYKLEVMEIDLEQVRVTGLSGDHAVWHRHFFPERRELVWGHRHP